MTRKILVYVVLALVVLIGAAGCYRKAAPDVTETPAAGAQADQPEATPENLETVIAATAIAETTRVAGALQASPTPPPPTEPSQPVVEPAPAAEATATPFPTVEPTSPAVPTFTPAPASDVGAAQAPGAAGPIKHIVQPGENLFRISLRYGLKTETVAAANGIANPALIYVGQELTIPVAGAQPPSSSSGETTYVVQPGDNLFRIALRYNMSYMYLAQYNHITNPASIYVGQVIRIPQ